MDNPRKVLRPTIIQERSGYSRTQLYRKSRDPEDDFPSPVQLGANAIGWYEDEFNEWLNSRPRVNYAAKAKSANVAPHQPEANAA